MRIEEGYPIDWRDLERRVGRILAECGFETAIQHRLMTARGPAIVDVYAVDKDSSPAIEYICECKHWSTALSRGAIHTLRSIVQDSGTALGVIVSSAGFQAGAPIAAEYTNLRLVDWPGFQALFYRKWLEHMQSTLAEAATPVLDLMDVFDSRVDAALCQRGSEGLFYALFKKFCCYVGVGDRERMLDTEHPFWAREIIDPRGPGNSKRVTFDTPREYFDALLGEVPRARVELATLLGIHGID